MRELLATLHRLRRSHGPGPARERMRLLRLGRARLPGTARRWLQWHDELLFAAAYPDNREVLQEATAGLHQLAAAGRRALLRKLANSGVAGSDVTGHFTPDLLAWMSTHRPNPAVVWDDGTTESVGALLPLLLLHSERDGLLAESLSDHDLWVLAAGPGPARWLVSRLATALPDPEARDRFLESHPLTWRWRLGTASRTLTRFPPRPVLYQTGSLLRQVPLGTVLATRLPPARPVGRRGAERLIDVARATLAARARETDTVTWANPREVELYRLGRGVDVALFGLAPPYRLPVESYFGFVAARNRVPVAYGGGWVFFGRCEIGVNLFPEFRGGESAVIFAQVLRTYRQRYRVAQFLVDPFQFGRDNPEAIRSGAFWFYYRLGFRPTDPEVALAAAAEWERLQALPRHRSPAATLRQFTTAPLFLDTGPAERGVSPTAAVEWRPVAPDLPALGLAVSRWIAERWHGDRLRAEAHAVRTVRAALGPLPRRGATGTWVTRLAPLLAMVPDLDAWPSRERRLLAAAVRAKGGAGERDYAIRLQALVRLRRAWQRLALHPPTGPA